MKLERVNDHQIRCTLTRSDLADRQLRLSELAYGTEKAKRLFRDMMQQASYELGFEANDIPLMIEAIPLSSDSIILIITKVEDPDELDTRFANFAPDNGNDEDDVITELFRSVTEEMPEVLDLFKKISEEVAKNPELIEEAKEKIEQQAAVSGELSRGFVFDSLAQVIDAAKIVSKVFVGKSSLYHDETGDCYVLALSKGEHTTEEFNRICNVLSEYGSMGRATPATEAYFVEHNNRIIADNAIETLLS
ncbi:MAG: adaptor protein MecA [Lachnospiraceae bacterium]|nr:adaptor protein MecA [Lachnospiraceae bacterium]